MFVCEKLFSVVMEGNSLPRHLLNSCLNTISVCVKCCIVSGSVFEDLFLRFLGIIQPTFVPNNNFIRPSSVSN